jgi:hydroxymethylpyrimidine/phosphomethylpyrimidine kinase
MPVPCNVIEEQLNAVLSDSDVRAIKTGMLYSSEIVEVVVETISDLTVPIVTDPVLVSGVGDSLATDDLVKAIKKKLMPVCDLITPNRFEAEAITGLTIRNEDDAMRACEIMGKSGTSVYLKGGHIDSAMVVDTLYHAAEFKRFEYPRLEKAGHGGGCTLSAFITAGLAKGTDMVNSIMNAREMIQRSIASMYPVGKGNKIVNSAVNIRPAYTSGDMTEGMEASVDAILKLIPASWVSPVGMNIAYATYGAKDPGDVAAVDGKISIFNGRPARVGSIRFGAAEHISYMILAAMRFDKDTRAAIDIQYDRDLLDLMEEVGMDITIADREKYPDARLGELTTFAIRDLGYVPDVIYDMGTYKRGPMIRMLAKDLDDLKKKIEDVI